MAEHMFVATQETQGKRENDFCFVPEGEIVIFPVLTCTNEEPDGECGCCRSMSGTVTFKATTTVKVVEVPSTVNLALVVERAWKEGGWTKGMDAMASFAFALKEARSITKLAGTFPVGAIVEIRGDELIAR